MPTRCPVHPGDVLSDQLLKLNKSLLKPTSQFNLTPDKNTLQVSLLFIPIIIHLYIIFTLDDESRQLRDLERRGN